VRLAALVLLAACYSPKAKPGARCSSTGECPSGLVCAGTGTCELTDVDAAIVIDVPPPDSAIDAPAGPPNDMPSGAQDVGSGGDFTADLTYAVNDSKSSGTTACGMNGGRDVFYSVTAPTSVVLYVDTFGSDFDSVVRVFGGACKGALITGTICHNDQCNSTQTQWVGTIPSGESCIVVSENVPGTAPAHLMMHVEVAAWNGVALVPGAGKTVSATTAGLADDSAGTCGGAGSPDKGYYFTSCPGQTLTLDASTCSAGTTYNTLLYVLGPNRTELACNDTDLSCVATTSGASTVHATATGGHLFWIIVDGPAAADSGAFTLTTTLQ